MLTQQHKFSLKAIKTARPWRVAPYSPPTKLGELPCYGAMHPGETNLHELMDEGVIDKPRGDNRNGAPPRLLLKDFNSTTVGSLQQVLMFARLAPCSARTIQGLTEVKKSLLAIHISDCRFIFRAGDVRDWLQQKCLPKRKNSQP